MSGWEGEGRHRPTLVSRSEAGAGVGAAVSSGVDCLQMILGATIAGILAANHRTMGKWEIINFCTLLQYWGSPLLIKLASFYFSRKITGGAAMEDHS